MSGGWSPISVPGDAAAQAEAVLRKARKVAATLHGFSTDAKLSEADAELADLAKLAQGLRLGIRGLQKARRAQDREAAAEAERAEAENARIRENRAVQGIAAISSEGAS